MRLQQHVGDEPIRLRERNAVTRRGGPDVVCASDEAHQQCEKLFQRMKQTALPAFGVEDDLLSMPHSVLVKIQFGGLLGLQRLQGDSTDESAAIKNIHGLVGQASGNTASRRHPCQAFVEDMTSYKLKRRR